MLLRICKRNGILFISVQQNKKLYAPYVGIWKTDFPQIYLMPYTGKIVMTGNCFDSQNEIAVDPAIIIQIVDGIVYV